MKTKLLNVLCLFFLVHVANGQDAKSLLSRCMEKSGPWGDLKSVTYTTKTLNHNKWQSRSFENPEPSQDEATRYFDFTERSFYFKTVGQYPGGYVFDYVTIGKDTAQVSYDAQASRNGMALEQGGKKAFDASWRAIYQIFPFFIVRDVSQSPDTLQVVNDSTVQRKGNGRTEDFVFLKNGLLSSFTRKQYGRTIHLKFSRYIQREGFSYPQAVKFLIDDELVRDEQVTEVKFNTSIDKNLLEVPKGYKVYPPMERMKVSEIAKNVYLIENVGDGRNVIFLNRSTGVVVTEAPLSPDVTREVIDLIHRTIPDKKISHVHLSHFHDDHLGGLSEYITEGATIVATPATIKVIQSFMGDSNEKFQPFSGSLRLTDPSVDIMLYEVSNSHAEGMSFLYLPADQILYESDLLSLPHDKTITHAIAVNHEFYKVIKKLNLKVKRIIGHHGANNIELNDLERAVKMK